MEKGISVRGEDQSLNLGKLNAFKRIREWGRVNAVCKSYREHMEMRERL